MRLDERKRILDDVSRTLAILSVDIDNHQSLNDLSLNIVAENWFRDLFNVIEEAKYLNLNFYQENAPKVDLVDHSQKKALQITSTGTKEKVDKTMAALSLPEYRDFDVSLYYLAGKPKLKASSKKEIFAKHGIMIDDHLFDGTDLVKKINNLDDMKLIDLYERFFVDIGKKYTENMVLDMTIRHLLRGCPKVPKRYDDDFGSVDTNMKIEINGINDRLRSKINGSLDFTLLFLANSFDEEVLGELKDYVVDVLYHQLLLRELRSRHSLKVITSMNTNELHSLAVESGLDFNLLLGGLHAAIDSSILVRDFNSMEIAWIIVSYFFEICELGVKEDAASK